ncbi:MAG: adenylate/guanylate cyclase domain-containing protein [Bacteroidia bacterium]
MSKKKWNVLFVDDEPDNCLVFKSTFRRSYNVFTASSGEEGLEILGREKIHLILTDQRMPGMTGVEFLTKLVPLYPEPMRIVVTGYSDIEAVINAINNGQVFRYILKPWNDTELDGVMQQALELYELRIQNRELLNNLQLKIEEQAQTLKLFSRYVPETIVSKSLKGDEGLFEGEVRHVAVLFCDIRGFTKLSEQLPPQEVVSFLNDYYAIMTEEVEAHEGSIGQYTGDEVFATFGALQNLANPEQSAVRCAMDMIKALEKLNTMYEGRVPEPIRVGIGINAGEVVAGTLGSHARLVYTVTGDTVNTGKRIEQLTKKHPNGILMSEGTFQKLDASIVCDPCDPVIVKGKAEALQLYLIAS